MDRRNRTWMALERRLGKNLCGGFMFMGRVNGINLYNCINTAY